MRSFNADLEPHRIAADTFVIHHHHRDPWPGGEERSVIAVNSMVIRGEQPVVVDTGAPIHRQSFLAALTAVVDPADVRWIFVSHEDVDHAGNLAALLSLCPRAVLVASWLAMQRLACAGLEIAADRIRWVDDGEAIDAGDRVLVAQRPPLYDSGSTIGLYDTSTGVYWAADCFATRMDVPARTLDELDPEVWRRGFVELQQWSSPWFDSVETRRWERSVDQLARRDLTAIAGAHGPVITGRGLGAALDLLRELPELPLAPTPGQALLDRIVADSTAAVPHRTGARR